MLQVIDQLQESIDAIDREKRGDHLPEVSNILEQIQQHLREGINRLTDHIEIEITKTSG